MKNKQDEDIKFIKQVCFGAASFIIITVVAFIILLFIVVGFTTGGKSSEGSYTKASEGNILVPIENNYYYYIAYDKETMVEYVISSGSANDGPVIITPLINADGTPKLYKEE